MPCPLNPFLLCASDTQGPLSIPGLIPPPCRPVRVKVQPAEDAKLLSGRKEANRGIFLWFRTLTFRRFGTEVGGEDCADPWGWGPRNACVLLA